MEAENGIRRRSIWVRVKPYLASIFLQIGYAGLYISTMIAFKHGLGQLVFVVYRHTVATFMLVPFAFFLERKQRPRLRLPVFFKILALGFLEPVMDQDFYFMGMNRTSATFSAAIANIAPTVTFIMAVILGLEKLEMKKLPSQAKVIGTAVTVTGATVLTLYRGPVINFSGSGGRSATHVSGATSEEHRFAGTLFLITSAVGWSGFLILQTLVVEEYPAKLSLAAMVCLVGMVESGVVAFVMERRRSAWVLGWDSRLFSVIYAGVVCSGIAYYLQSMVSQERGPVFTISFYPLCMVVTAALGFLVLSEQLHLGSIIGAMIIVIGVYLVIWGKSKDLPHIKKDEYQKEKAEQQHELTTPIGDQPKMHKATTVTAVVV